MPIDYTALWFAAMLVLCIFLWWIRKPIKYILIFVLQSVGGIASILAINAIFSVLHINLFVGVNWITTGIVGILGLPGVALLYIVNVMYS